MSQDGEAGSGDSETGPETGLDIEPDVSSDPALGDESGSEWADEGGATDEGPASETDAS